MENRHLTDVALIREIETTYNAIEMHRMNCSRVALDEESLKENIPMTEYTYQKLTTESYGPLPSPEDRLGGFYFTNTGKISSVEFLKQSIEEYACETERQIRLGTEFEFLLYMKLGLPVPTRCISIHRIIDFKILFQCDFNFGEKLHLFHSSDQQWRPDCGVFIIEEL